MRDNSGFIKGIIICAIIIGIIGTHFINNKGNTDKQNVEHARQINDSLHISEFLKQMDGDYAIYTGKITADKPVTMNGLDGQFMYVNRKIEEKYKTYNDDTDEWETKWRTISNDTNKSDTVSIDDVSISYNVFSNLPKNSYNDRHYDEKWSFNYINTELNGTFFIKGVKGEIKSVKYYSSSDVLNQVDHATKSYTAILWGALIVICGVIIFARNYA